MYRKEYLKRVLDRFQNEFYEKEAFSVYDGIHVRRISFGKFRMDILKAAAYFQSHNIVQEHIALAAENSYEWYVAFFAVLASGNIAVLINPDLPENEILDQCEFAEVSIVFCGKRKWQNKGKMKALNWQELTERSQMEMKMVYEPDKDALSCLLFTSGTLGSNKAVMLSAGNLEVCMSDVMDKFHVQRTILVLPLYHISGIGGTLYLLANGKCVCIGRGVKYIFQDLPILNPDHMSMVPGIMESFIKILKRCADSREREKHIGTALKHLGVGGAAAGEESCRYLIKQGFELGTGYGLSETAGYGTAGMLTESRLKSIGKPLSGMQCRIENGEILLSGSALMLGYYKDQEATQTAVKNGWLYTGDLGYQDSDGWYYLTGRKKNVIILSNGENVSPEQLEEILGRCEDILECLVYSVPKGICADIYTKDRPAAAAYIKNYNHSVPTYRQIFRINYSDAPLEKTGSGKIKRKENQYE